MRYILAAICFAGSALAFTQDGWWPAGIYLIVLGLCFGVIGFKD